MIYSCNAYIHTCVIFVVVNHEPEVVYMRLEEKLLNGLPADQPGFIKLLANEGIIGEKARKKMNMPNKTRASCAAAVLHEFNTSPFPNEKFYKLLSVMKQYKHGMEILAEEIETHLDPGINACNVCKYVHIYVQIYVYVIYVSRAGGIYLICTHNPEARSTRANISGKSRPHMLHMLCNSPGTLKICQNLPNAALLLYIRTDAVYDYWIFI